MDAVCYKAMDGTMKFLSIFITWVGIASTALGSAAAPSLSFLDYYFSFFSSNAPVPAPRSGEDFDLGPGSFTLEHIVLRHGHYTAFHWTLEQGVDFEVLDREIENTEDNRFVKVLYSVSVFDNEPFSERNILEAFDFNKTHEGVLTAGLLIRGIQIFNHTENEALKENLYRYLLDLFRDPPGAYGRKMLTDLLSIIPEKSQRGDGIAGIARQLENLRNASLRPHGIRRLGVFLIRCARALAG